MKPDKNTLIVELSHSAFTREFLKLNNKKKKIHSWISSKKIEDKSINFINNQCCINGTNFKIKNNSNKTRVFLKSSELLLAKNMLKRQMPLSKMTELNKKKFLNFLINNWSKFLKDNKIKKVFFYNTPHLTYAYIIYCLCKKYKIKTIILEHTKYLKFFYFINKIEKISAKSVLNSKNKIPKYIKDYLNQFKDSKNIQTHRIQDNDSKFELLKIFYRSFIRPIFKEKKILNFFFKKQKVRFHNYSQYLPYEKKSFHTKFYDNFFYFKSYLISKKLFKNYQNNSISINQLDKNYKYILFSANFQPEKSTSPDAGIFFDQFKILQKLNKFCESNKNYKIIYKEHPSQFLTKRFGFMEKDSNFYNKVLKLQNVIFLNINTPTVEAIKKCNFIATATSEMALQGLLLNKPSVVFGFIWYSNCRGVYCYKNNLKNLISSMSRNKFNSEDLKKFLLGLINKNNLNLNTQIKKNLINNFIKKYFN